MPRLRHLLVAGSLVAGVTLLPLTAASAAPLPPGDYGFDVDGAAVRVTVEEDGTATYAAPEGIVVLLSHDDEGRVLDEFVVATDSGRFDVEVHVDEDGVEASVSPSDEDTGGGETKAGDEEDEEDDCDDTGDGRADGGEGAADEPDDGDGSTADGSAAGDAIDRDESAVDEAGDEGADCLDGGGTADDEDDDVEEADGSHGELVSTVARCAPRGTVARDAGLPVHGAVVGAVARGEESLTLTLPAADDPSATDDEATSGMDPDDTSTVEASFDLTSRAGVDELCTALAEAVTAAQTAEESAEADEASRRAAREQARAERDAEREAARQAREEARARREAEREAEEAARDEAKAQREAARDEAKAQREAARDEARAQREAARDEARADRGGGRSDNGRGRNG